MAKNDQNELPGWQLDQLDFPTFRMGLLAKAMDRLTSRQLAEEFNLSYAQWRVIARLGGTKQSATVGQIAEQAWADRAEVSRAVSALEAQGLLQRSDNPSDRRAHVLGLSESGRALYKRVIRKRASFHRELIDDLEPADLKQLDALLDRIRAKLEKSTL